MKRGLSEVVTSVLLILVVIGAVAIIWAFAKPVFESSSSDTSIGLLTTDFKLSEVEINETSRKVAFNVQRQAGGGSISGFKVVLSDVTGASEIFTVNQPLGELESYMFIADYTIGKISKIEIVPFVLQGSVEKLGSTTGSYVVKGNEQAGNSTGAVCGNGISEFPETCDDGNTNNGDGCSSTCQTEVQTLSCPDGNIDIGEVCDGNDLNGQTCNDLGYVAGSLGCYADCSNYNTSSCSFTRASSYLDFQFPPTPLDKSLSNSSYRVKLWVNTSSSAGTSDRYSYIDFRSFGTSARPPSKMAGFSFDYSISGSPADIHSTTARVGTLRGAASIDSNGRYGKSLKLDGTNSYLEFPDRLALENKQAFSVSLWFKANKLPFSSSQPGIIGIGDAKVSGFFPGNKTLFLYGSGSTNTLTLVSGTIGNVDNDCQIDNIGPITQGEWYHATIIKNMSSCYFYLNGTKSGMGVDEIIGTDYLTSTNTRTAYSNYGVPYSNLGSLQDSTGADSYFNGSIDEFIVFDRQISEQEIGYLFNGGDYDVVLSGLNSSQNHSIAGLSINSSGHFKQTLWVDYYGSS